MGPQLVDGGRDQRVDPVGLPSPEVAAGRPRRSTCWTCVQTLVWRHDRQQPALPLTTGPTTRGPFDPDFRYEDLSKEALVRLVREYALIVHLLDRSMCAAIGMKYGQEVVEELAIEEWRGASPIYGDRLRQVMGIEGDGVEAIFKVLQLDPGFPQHYMDVQYEIVDDHHGFFELAVVRRAHGRRAVGRAGHHRHVPHDRGRHLRPHRAGGEPEGARQPRAPPAAPAGRPRAALPVGDHDRRRQRDARGADRSRR